MKAVIITGSAGFSGRALTERLDREPDLKVYPLSRAHVDLSFAPDIARVLSEIKPDWIFHLAGRLKGSASEIFQDNLQNTICLLDAAARIVPNARILLIGSAAEYGHIPDGHGPVAEDFPCHPANPYGISKYAMTLAGLDFATRTSLQINIARAFNLIGPGIPPTLLLGAIIQRGREAAKAGKTIIPVGEVTAERDFIDVRDAVEAYLAIMRSPANREIFNVCSGLVTPIKTLVEAALQNIPGLTGYHVFPTLAPAGAKSVIGNPRKIQAIGFTPKITLTESLAAACTSP